MRRGEAGGWAAGGAARAPSAGTPASLLQPHPLSPSQPSKFYLAPGLCSNATAFMKKAVPSVGMTWVLPSAGPAHDISPPYAACDVRLAARWLRRYGNARGPSGSVGALDTCAHDPTRASAFPRSWRPCPLPLGVEIKEAQAKEKSEGVCCSKGVSRDRLQSGRDSKAGSGVGRRAGLRCALWGRLCGELETGHPDPVRFVRAAYLAYAGWPQAGNRDKA